MFYEMTVTRQEVEPEMMRRKPISMFQNHRVFGANQTPGMPAEEHAFCVRYAYPLRYMLHAVLCMLCFVCGVPA